MSLVVALLLVFVLPSVAAGVLLSGPSRADATGVGRTDLTIDPPDPEGDPNDVVLARGLACGIATWLLGSGILTRTVGLTTAWAWAWEAVCGAASVMVLLLPRQRARLREMLGPACRRLLGIASLTALVYLPVAIVVLRTWWSPFGSTPWYYYGLARQVAESGSIPATSVEFATKAPFLNDYHLFTTGTAMLLVQFHGGPVTVLTVITFVSVLLMGVGAVAFASALGARRVAALRAVPIAIATGIGPNRLTAYRPEAFGLGLELLVLALGTDWLRRRDRRSLIAAAPLVAALSQVHGIAALCTGVLVTGVAVALALQGTWKEQLRRTAIVLGVFLGAVGVTVLLFHEASGTATASGRLVDRGGVADPTWEFYQAARGRPPSVPPNNGGMLWSTLRSLYGASFWWVVPLLVLAVLGLRRRWHDPQARRIASFTLASLLGLALVSTVFMLGWQGYVPRRTGASRIPLESSLLLAPLLAVGLDCLARRAMAWRVRGRTRTFRRPLPALLTVLAAASVISMIGTAVATSGAAIGRQQLALWESLPLHRDDVVLANGYTEGFIPDVTPAEGLLDGRAPYTFGGLLHRADRLFRDAQAFFTDPSRHWDYLAQHHVTWVVVGRPGTYAISTANTWSVPHDLVALEQCRGLQKVAGDPTLTVFRVVDSAPSGCR
jgi:hypothetical protein